MSDNETIGIEFSIRGADQMFQTVTRLRQATQGLQGDLSGFSRYGDAFRPLSRDLSSLQAAFSEARESASALRSINRITSTTERRISRLTRTTQEYARALNDVRRAQQGAFQPPPMGPGGRVPAGMPGGRSSGDRMSPYGGWGPYGFMGRWWLAYNAVRGTERMVHDTMLGGAREDIIHPLRDLAAVAFDAKQRKLTEEMGMRFLRKNWATGGLPDYLSSVAEAASAFDVNMPGFKGKGVEAMNLMAQQGMLMGAVTQMKPEAAQKLLMQSVHARLAQMPLAERQQYDKGDRLLTTLSEQTATQTAKVIEIASVWGREVATSMQYALPAALSRGWQLSDILGFVSELRTSGIHAGRAGRGLKTIIEGETSKFARLSIGMDPAKLQMYEALRGAGQKEFVGREITYLDQMLKKDPFAYFRQMGQLMDRAESQGKNLVQSYGFSKDWISIVRMLTRESFLQGAQEKALTTAKAQTLDQVKGRLEDVQGDPGYWPTRLQQSWSSLTRTLARNSRLGGQVGSWTDTMDQLTDWLQSPEKFSLKAAGREGWDFFRHGLIGGMGDLGMRGLSQLRQEAGIPESWYNNIFQGIFGTLEKNFREMDQSIARMSTSTDPVARISEQAQGAVDALGASVGTLGDRAAAARAAFEAAWEAFNPRAWFEEKNRATTAPEGVPGVPFDLGGPAPRERAAAPIPPYEAPPPEQLTPGNEWVPQITNHVTVKIGEQEIRDIVQEAIAEINMENYNKGFGGNILAMP